jgi:hypothetical protein
VGHASAVDLVWRVRVEAILGEGVVRVLLPLPLAHVWLAATAQPYTHARTCPVRRGEKSLAVQSQKRGCEVMQHNKMVR